MTSSVIPTHAIGAVLDWMPALFLIGMAVFLVLLGLADRRAASRGPRSRGLHDGRGVSGRG